MQELLFVSQADVMLVKNAQNLMQAVIKTVQAAEAACMRVSSRSRERLSTVLQSKRRKFHFEELQLKYFFHVFSMSYVY